jgi:hypothetical protein
VQQIQAASRHGHRHVQKIDFDLVYAGGLPLNRPLSRGFGTCGLGQVGSDPVFGNAPVFHPAPPKARPGENSYSAVKAATSSFTPGPMVELTDTFFI